MKVLKTKEMTFAALAVLLALISGTFQSCNIDENATQELEKETNTNMELRDSDKNIIINSTEFEEYVEATADLAIILKDIDTKLKSQLTANQLKSSSNPFYIDQNLLERISSKKAILIEKYPSFLKVNPEGMKELMNISLKKDKIFEILRIRGLLKMRNGVLRRKVSSFEDPGSYAFNNLSDFYASAASYSNDKEKECSGFMLSDGSFVLYISSTAEGGKTEYPDFDFSTDNTGACVAMYNGKQIIGTYHTHPTNFFMSDTDQNVQANYFENMPATIIYGGIAYTYNFAGGQMTNTSSIVYPDGNRSTTIVNSDGSRTTTSTDPYGNTKTRTY